jgi:hypothetical protein
MDDVIGIDVHHMSVDMRELDESSHRCDLRRVRGACIVE